MTASGYSRERLAQAAAASSSIVDLIRRLGAPPGSGTRAYLSKRLRHYGIDTSHFQEELIPRRTPRSYTKELLSDAARRSSSIRDVIEHLGFSPRDTPYGHIRKRLDQYGIDTSHFSKALPHDELVPAVEASFSLASVLRALGRADTGAGRALVKRSIEFHGVSTEHFTGQGHFVGVSSPRRKSAQDILRRLPLSSPRTRTTHLRRALDDLGVLHRCTACGLGDVWMGKRLVLEIDHINGDHRDNRRENLRYLCPSCHSQTETFSKRRKTTQ